MEITNKVFITLFITLLLIPTVYMIFDIKEGTVQGVTVNHVKPEKSVKSILRGTYQFNYGQWMSQNFPSRSHLIELYSHAKFDLFKTTSASTILVGKDNYFYETWYITPIPYDKENAKTYIKQISEIQALCDQLGKEFIFIITPHKGMIYPEYAPLRYSYSVQAMLDEQFHKQLQADLNAAGIKYIDAVDYLLELKSDSSYPFFTRTGIHWTYVAVATLLKHISDLSYLSLPDFRILDVVESDVSEDQDVFRVANLKRPLTMGKQTSFYPELNKYTGIQRKGFIAGTSFNYHIVKLLLESGYFSDFTEIRYQTQHLRYSYFDGRIDLSVGVGKFIDYVSILKDKDVIIMNSSAVIIDQTLTHTATMVNHALTQIVSGVYASQQLALPPDASNIDIIPLIELVEAPAGTFIQIPVSVTNNSNSILTSLMPHPVNFSSHWMDAQGGYTNFDGARTGINGALLPGETISLNIDTLTPDIPGEYTLELTMVQELVMWFEHQNPKLPVKIKAIIH